MVEICDDVLLLVRAQVSQNTISKQGSTKQNSI